MQWWKVGKLFLHTSSSHKLKFIVWFCHVYQQSCLVLKMTHITTLKTETWQQDVFHSETYPSLKVRCFKYEKTTQTESKWLEELDPKMYINKWTAELTAAMSWHFQIRMLILVRSRTFSNWTKPTHTYNYSDQLIYAYFHVYTCDCAWLTHLPKKLQQYMKPL